MRISAAMFLRRGQSDTPKSALKSNLRVRHNGTPGLGLGGGGSSVPRFFRYNSEDHVRTAAGIRLAKDICYQSVVGFVRQCSVQDLNELQEALALPITWSMVSHRTWGNVTKAMMTQMSSPHLFSAPSGSPANFEAIVKIDGFSCYLVHEPSTVAGKSGVDRGSSGGGGSADREIDGKTSEVRLGASTLICLSKVREDSEDGDPQPEPSHAGKGAKGSSNGGASAKSRPLVRDLVCQLASGKWQVNVFMMMMIIILYDDDDDYIK
jgi:hypothetical protein